MSQPSNHNTYLPGYAASNVKHHEWRTAENSAAYLLPALRSKAASNPDLTLLDVGAGSGTISASLATYMPQGHVIATDLSPDILTRAALHAKDVGVHNISFQPASIYSLPFEDNTFDIVHAHQVLCHLDAPAQALREMLRVMKPGGVLASRECDMRMWSFWPKLPGIEAMHKLLQTTHAAAGGSNTAGPQLVAWAMQAGARREQIEASMGTWCYSTLAERQVWGGTMAERIRNGEMRRKALEMSVTSEPELEEMARAWDEWIATEDACFGCMHGEILVRK